MKQVSEMPKEGQFVAVWIYENKIWSGTYDWVNDRNKKILSRYDRESDSFRPIDDTFEAMHKDDVNPVFFTAD